MGMACHISPWMHKATSIITEILVSVLAVSLELRRTMSYLVGTDKTSRAA